MNTIDPALQYQIDDIIDRKGEIIVVAYSLLEKTEHIIRYILQRIFSHHDKEELLDPVFSSIKELTTNAIKANIKKILIDEGTISNPDDQLEVVKGIKSILNERSLLEYGLKCRTHELSMRLHLNLDESTLTARVIDPLSLSDQQHERILGKIENAKGYENLAMCYLENPDPLAEGMGLGLSMVVVLLKGSMIPAENFRIINDRDANKTIAQLEIPLQ